MSPLPTATPSRRSDAADASLFAISPPAAAQRLRPTALYADSDEQRIELSSSQGCLNQLEAFSSVTLVLGNATIQAAVVEAEAKPQTPDPKAGKPSANLVPPPPAPALPSEAYASPPPTPAQTQQKVGPKSYFLRTGKVPADIPLGTQDLEVHVSQSLLGTLRIAVKAPGIRVLEDSNRNPDLAVGYGSGALDAWHSGKAVDGLAVVTPKEADEFGAVLNTASLDVDSSLAQLGVSLSPGSTTETKACQDLWTATQSAWLSEKGGAPLDAGDPEEFCTPAKFRASRPVTPEEDAKLAECFGLALEFKVDVCKEKLDDGSAPFSPVQDQQLEAFRNKRAWKLKEGIWGADVWFAEDWLRRSEARQVDLSRIAFAVYEPQKAPLRVSAELHDPQGQTWFRATVVLAKGARLESLPLPLGSALVVECGPMKAQPTAKPGSTSKRPPARFGWYSSPASEPKKKSVAPDGVSEVTDEYEVRDRAPNGAVKAVADDDLDSGSCVLRYSPEKMRSLLRPDRADSPAPGSVVAAQAAEDLRDEIARLNALLQLYGEQLVEVVVTRGTEPSVTKSWSLNPAKTSRLPLPGIKSRAGDYTVVAHLKGPQPLSVIYRPGPQQSSTAPGNAADLSTDLEFHATLRPRGLGGWLGDHWRTFITFPIRFTGLRFPAKSSELSTSGDVTAIQLAGVRAGMLGVLEPWNYDTRRNPSGVPYRFMGGFNLYDLGTGKFAPASLLGLALTLPVLPIDGTPNARNLDSTIAIGAFWEVDLERPHPLKDGNHLLITVGIDLASLLSE